MFDANLISTFLSRHAMVRNQTIVVFVTCSVILDDNKFKNFIDNLSLFISNNPNVILVHDYPEISKDDIAINYFLNNKKNSINFDNRNNFSELFISEFISKKITDGLFQNSINAISISGKNSAILSGKNNIKKYGKELNIPASVDPELIMHLSEIDLIPIIFPIGYDNNFKTIFFEPYIASAMIAQFIGAHRLIILSDDISKEQEVFIDCNKYNNSRDISNNKFLNDAINYALRSICSVNLCATNKKDSLLVGLFNTV